MGYVIRFTRFMYKQGDSKKTKHFAITKVIGSKRIWFKFYVKLYIYETRTLLGKVDGQIIEFTLNNWTEVSARVI